MRKALAILAVLSFASSASGSIIFTPATGELNYGAPGDLSSVVDPKQEQADVAAEFGTTLTDFNLLSPYVVAFNAATGPAGGDGKVLKIVANYGTGTMTFDNVHNTGGYNYGGYDSAGRCAFSGPSTFSDVSLAGGDAGWIAAKIEEVWPGDTRGIGLSFFGGDLAVSEAGMAVTALAICFHGRNGDRTGVGDAIFSLTDGTFALVRFDEFGNWNNVPANPQSISVAYQAPEGVGITNVLVITDPGGGQTQYIAADDLGFTIGVPEPASMLLLLVGGIGLVIRRKR